MPSVSKNQQRAASIALKAKKDGTVSKLSKKSASYQMATSMSIKELEKFAGTKRKGLPQKKNEGKNSFSGKSLKETFSEEMLDTDEPGEEISSDKNRCDQLKDADNEVEDDTGWDDYDHMWTQKAATNPTQGGNASGMDAMGVARVGFESKNSNPNSLDILFEQDYGYEHDYDDQAGIARSEMLGDEIESIEEDITKDVEEDLDTVHADPTVKLFGYNEPDPPLSKELAIELVDAYLSDLNPGGRTMRKLEAAYGDRTPREQDHRWPSPLIELVAKDLGEQIWHGWVIKHGFMEPRTERDEHMLKDMVEFLMGYYDRNGNHPSEWSPEELLGDFDYEYVVDARNKKDLSIAEEAITKAVEMARKDDESGKHTMPTSEAVFNKWKNLAGILSEKNSKKWMQGATNPKEKGELSKKLGVPEKKNIPMGLLLKKKKALQAKGEGDKKLSKADRETLDQIIFAINAKKSKKKSKKITEGSSLEYLSKGKAHRVNLQAAHEELATLANEVALEIENMHLDNSDRKTERMSQNKLENIYRHLEKLRRLAN